MFKNITEIQKTNLNVKILLYGDSGAGKTWASVSAPKPLVLLTERNGLVSIHHSNPKAVVAIAASAKEVREIFQEILKNGLKKWGCETLVVDGLTEIQRMFKDEILEKSNKRIFSLQNWGELTETMRKFMRMLRALDCSMVCTALSSYIQEEETSRVLPAFEGQKTAQEIAQYFSAVGFVYRREEKIDKSTKFHHRIMFEGPTRVLCKPCAPIKGVVEADLKEIFKLIRGSK
jgi:hypothetical protein